MDADAVDEASNPKDDIQASELEAESSKMESIEVMSSGGDTIQELENAWEVLTRVELDLACHSDKLLNLEVLFMHVAARESDFEAFVSEKEATFDDSTKKALQFDLLSGVLESELNEEEKFLVTIQSEINSTANKISSNKYKEEIFKEIQEKLLDCGKSLKQSLEQVSEMRLQSDNFKRILSSFSGGKNEKDIGNLDNGEFSYMTSKIRMQTVEEQSHVLRMFEKSLARELDLEKKLSELRQSEEILKLGMEQELFSMEEDVEITWERLLEAENAAEVLFGKSKELMNRLQMVQFNLNGSIQREGELKSKCEEFTEQLKAKENTLQNSESITAELREKVNSLEKQLEESKLQVHNLRVSAEKKEDSDSKIHEMENVISCLRGGVTKAEKKAESAEAECKFLRDSNLELIEKLNLVKTSTSRTANEVNLLEKQLRESDGRLQHAVAYSEATMERQTMLLSMVKDMENLINTLRSKVEQAENQTESAEDKCIILSEANSDLTKELNSLRCRIQFLEASLHQNEETKKSTAKDITMQTKLITDLIVQLALERERLHKQISLLMKEKRVLLKRLQKSEDLSVNTKSDIKESKKDVTYVEETQEEISELSASSHECQPEATAGVPTSKAETSHLDSAVERDTDAQRNIDAKLINFKYIFGAIFVFVVSALAAAFLRHQDLP